MARRIQLAAVMALCLAVTASSASARRVAAGSELRQLAAGVGVSPRCISAMISQRAPDWAVATYARDAGSSCRGRERALLMHHRVHRGWRIAGDARASESWCPNYAERFAPAVALLELGVCRTDSEVWALLSDRALGAAYRQIYRRYRARQEAATPAGIECPGETYASPQRPVRVPCRFDLYVGDRKIQRTLVTATWDDWRFVVTWGRTATFSTRPVACGDLPDKPFPRSGLRIVDRSVTASATFGCDSPFLSDIDHAVRRALPRPLQQRYGAARTTTDLVGFRYSLDVDCIRSVRRVTGGRRYLVRCATNDDERLIYRFTARADLTR